MSAPPLVSVVVAAHDHAAFIRRALDSVLAQEPFGGTLEVVVVDDGSTDATPEVLRGYAGRVRIIRQDNRGHLGAFNRGIAEAKGTYIALLDGDDEWLPDKLRRQVALLEADPALGMVYGDMQVVDADGAVLVDSFQRDRCIEHRRGGAAAFGYLMAHNFAQTSTIVVRSALRERFHPIPDWGRAQDWWIALQVSLAADVAPVGGQVVRYRQHGANLYLHDDRVREAQLRARELELRRWTFARARERGVAIEDLVRAYRELQRCVATAAAGTGRHPHDLAPDRVERAAAAEALLTGAVQAARAGDHVRAARDAVAVLADFPRDAHAIATLDRAVRALAGAPAPTEPRPAPAPDPLAGARAFVTLAFAAELQDDPGLLAAYAGAFGDEDDATLAVHALGADDDAAVAGLLAALGAAGVDPAAGPDILVVNQPAGEASEAALARGAHAVLTRRAAPARFAALPATAAPDALRALATARWAAAPLDVAITICPPDWASAPGWGDTHFAQALATELRRRGHRPHVAVVHEWDGAEVAACDVALHLRGLWPAVPRPGQRSLLWVISHPELVGGAECDRYDHVFVASATDAERLAALTSTPVSVLEQATDPAVFFPEPDPAAAHEVAFVGNSRGVLRRALADLLPTDRDLAVWGAGWEGLIDGRHVVAPHLANDAVRRVYTSAGVVLNDHWDDMRERGYVSNRVYDALACGAALLSDDVAGLRERFGDTVATFAGRGELHAQLDRLLDVPGARAAAAARGRELVLAGHTFGHRVDALLAVIAQQASAPLAATR
jgi:hypothetical protein